MSKEVSHCVCLSVMVIVSVFKIGKNCQLQAILEEHKYKGQAKVPQV